MLTVTDAVVSLLALLVLFVFGLKRSGTDAFYGGYLAGFSVGAFVMLLIFAFGT